LTFETLVPAPRPVVFAFFAKPRNLARLLEGAVRFELLEVPPDVAVGRVLRAAVRYGPLWLHFAFRHTLYLPPQVFAEHQIQGPFAHFMHVHELEEADGGTLVRDRIEVRLPLWLGGELAVRLFVAPKLRRIFEHRRRRLLELALTWPRLVPRSAAG